MLIFLDSVCKKHKIKYILSSGTLLGAVRHGGFIPWDDDIDIELEKKEYNKLVSVLPDELHNTNYVIQSRSTDSFYRQNFIKLRDLNSFLDEDDSPELKYRGCYVDVFPMQPRNEMFAKLSLTLTNVFLNRLYCPSLPYLIKRSYIQSCSFFLFRILFRFFDLFTVDSKYIGHRYGVGFSKHRNIENWYPLQSVKFEGHVFYAPKDIDKYLTELFGNDYMEIPSEADRATHYKYVEIR